VDLADLLVRRGVPFRSAHGVVAGLVRISVDSGRRLSELTDEEVRSASPELDLATLQEVLRPTSWLESKISEGGTALDRVRDQLVAVRAALAG